jgi:hypothetical protein
MYRLKLNDEASEKGLLLGYQCAMLRAKFKSMVSVIHTDLAEFV